MKCKTSDWGCAYHACMSDDCQKAEVLKSTSLGQGNCEKKAYSIQTAAYTFNCPACETKVRKGDAYMLTDTGRGYCFCQMPVRKLIPLKEYEKNKAI